MTSLSLRLLEEFCRHAGLGLPPYAPDACMGLVIDDHLITIDLPGETTLKLLTTLTLPPGQEEPMLLAAADHNERRGEAGGPLASFGEGRVLAIYEAMDVAGMHYPEFERKLTAFVALCDRLIEAGAARKDGDPPPDFAIYV